MAVTAGVVGDDRVGTRRVLATRDMATEGRRAAVLDGIHHLNANHHLNVH